jgi:1,4-dihydroxy-6-naphthoate synthase
VDRLENRPARLCFSPCPNDTFIFHALTAGLVPAPAALDVRLADVEVLNRWAAEGAADVCKVSAQAVAGLLSEWIALRSGGAVGYGVGPLVVAKPGVALADLHGRPVAVPGARTTANLLFSLACRQAGIEPRTGELVFDRIMPAVAAGEFAAGVVIHEGRFTFGQHGLSQLVDLGEWWERGFGLPIPLGLIVARRSLGEEFARAMQQAVRASLLAARADPARAWPYIKKHAQEMDDAVIQRHIETFVTGFSLDVGLEGEAAVARLLAEAARAGGFALPGCEVFVRG